MAHEPTSELIALSDAGRRRRDAMRGELQTAMRRVHQRRRAARRTVGVLTVLVIGALAWRSITPPRPPQVVKHAPGINTREVQPVEDPTQPSISFARVTTDDRIAGSVEAKPTGLIQRIDDQELLDSLADMGRPTGLIRIGGETRLTSNVSDSPAKEGSEAPGQRDAKGVLAWLRDSLASSSDLGV